MSMLLAVGWRRRMVANSWDELCHVRNLVRSRCHQTRSILVLLGGGLLTITLLLVRNISLVLHCVIILLANN